MKIFDRVLIIVTSTLSLLCVVFAVAAIFVPDFRDNGANISIVILGALTTMAGSVLTGSYFARDLKAAPKKEHEEDKKEVDSGDH